MTENQGEVSLRFDAPAAIRAGLELSVHNLVESLTRAQVPLSDVMFEFESSDADSLVSLTA